MINDDIPPITAEEGIREWASVAWHDIQHARSDESALEEAKNLACCVEIDAERIGGEKLVAQLPWRKEQNHE